MNLINLGFQSTYPFRANPFPGSGVFVLLYLIGSVLWSSLLVQMDRIDRFPIADELLILLIPPLFYAVFHYSRATYLLSLTIFYAISAVSLYFTTVRFSASFITLTIVIAVLLPSLEIVHHFRLQMLLLTQTLEKKIQERTKELLKHQEHLQALTYQLTLAEQEEKRKIARELHDYLAQMLVLCKMRLRLCMKEPLPDAIRILHEEIYEQIEKSLQYTRDLIAEICPSVLQESGLYAALRWLGDSMQKQHKLNVHIRQSGEEQEIGYEKSVMLFHVVRELLLNVVKHAGVNHAELILITEQPGWLTVQVKDEGTGFSLEALEMNGNNESGSFGLRSLQDRVQPFGGKVEIASSFKRGTCVTLSLPV